MVTKKTALGMKKIFLSILMSCALIFGASAQGFGRWSIGPRMNIYANTGDRAIIGLGAYARLPLGSMLRLEPAITALFDEGSSIDAQVDLHFPIHLSGRWGVYPLVGVTVNDIGKWAVGMNVGGGVDFEIAKQWDLSASVKWMPIFDGDRRNPVVISIGGAYRF